MPNQFDYYYENNVEQFRYYQIPKELMHNPIFSTLSLDAKLVYAVLRDRMKLSRTNGWLDEEGRVYIIFSIDEVAECMSIGRDKAIKHLKELEQFGLIEKKRRGLGLSSLLYVKNFATVLENKMNQSACDDEPQSIENSLKSEKSTSGSRKNRLQEIGKTDFKKSENPTSESRENRLQEIGKSDPNKNNINNPYISENEVSDTHSFNPSEKERSKEEHPIVTLRIDERLSEEQDNEIRRSLEKNKGIPFVLVSAPERMKQVMMVLAGWGEEDWQSEADAGRLRLYRLIIENLTEMALERQPWDCRGSRITYKHVIDKLNALYSGNHYSLHYVVERIAERFQEASKQTDIGNPKMYLKAMIWEMLCNYEVEMDAYYSRQLHLDFGY